MRPGILPGVRPAPVHGCKMLTFSVLLGNRRQTAPRRSELEPCNMCAGAIVQFGVAKVFVGESENFQENGLELMLRHGVEVIDLDLDETKDLLRNFIQHSPQEWQRDIGRNAQQEATKSAAPRRAY